MNSREQPSRGNEHQAEDGVLQMAGAVALYEVGMNLNSVVWGASFLVCSMILGAYGLKDFAIGKFTNRS